MRKAERDFLLERIDCQEVMTIKTCASALAHMQLIVDALDELLPGFREHENRLRQEQGQAVYDRMKVQVRGDFEREKAARGLVLDDIDP